MLKGYGSNCIAFEAEMVREDGSLHAGQAAYYSQVQDCRIIEISEESYNYTKSFSYSGTAVLGKLGHYPINVEAFDQIMRQNYRTSARSLS